MTEQIKPTLEKEERTESERYLENLNSSAWQRLSALAPDEQFEYWLNLTQEHLNGFKRGELQTEKFKEQELELLLLNALAAGDLKTLNPKMEQRGFYLSPESAKQKVEKLSDSTSFICSAVKEKTGGPFRVMVTGIGTSGKATMRTVLARELSHSLPNKKIISWDRDYQKLFPSPWPGDVEIIEDVHGLDTDKEGRLVRFDGQDGLPDGFDLVVYTLAPEKTYRQSLISRGKGWLRAGILDLTDQEVYQKEQTKRVTQTARKLEDSFKIAGPWIKDQLRSLKTLKGKGTKILVIDPTSLLKELYGLDIGERRESFLGQLEKEI